MSNEMYPLVNGLLAVSGKLRYVPDDYSQAALAWRNESLFQTSTELLKNLPWAGRKQRWTMNPLQPHRAINLQELAFAYEIGQGFVGLHKHIRGTRVGLSGGMIFFGVKTEQSIVDAAVIQYLLQRTKTDLLIEFGTYCGGSAVYYSKMMQDYNPNAIVATIDVNADRPFCYQTDAVKNPIWTQWINRGSIVSIIGRLPHIADTIQRLVERSTSVMIIDDGDHAKTSVLNIFKQMSAHVTPNNYYIVQDTRLDFDCAYSYMTTKTPYIDIASTF